jgi:hypothetical protein
VREERVLFLRLCLSVFAALVVLLFHSTIVFAADPSDDIDTNRPSFMFSPIVLPKGSLQLENGLLDSGLRRGSMGFDLPETQVRIGLARSTEFQVFVPNYVLRKSGGDFCSGVTDLSEIGIKQQLPTPGKLKVAIIASVTAPTGAKRLGLGGTSGILRLPYAYAINDRWCIGGMQSLLLINHGNNLQWQPDVLISRSIGNKACAFIEYGGYFTSHNFPINLIHLGAVYKVTRHQQIDTHCGFGLSQTAPSAFVGGGYSFRFDGVF